MKNGAKRKGKIRNQNLRENNGTPTNSRGAKIRIK
jgi:hypothetical protein